MDEARGDALTALSEVHLDAARPQRGRRQAASELSRAITSVCGPAEAEGPASCGPCCASASTTPSLIRSSAVGDGGKIAGMAAARRRVARLERGRVRRRRPRRWRRRRRRAQIGGPMPRGARRQAAVRASARRRPRSRRSDRIPRVAGGKQAAAAACEGAGVVGATRKRRTFTRECRDAYAAGLRRRAADAGRDRRRSKNELLKPSCVGEMHAAASRRPPTPFDAERRPPDAPPAVK